MTILVKFLVFLTMVGLLAGLSAPASAQKKSKTGSPPTVKVTPTPTPTAVSEVDSFQLFWPIVAGKVMGEPLYALKSLKEAIREIFVFSNFKKVDYNIILSEKRAVEAEKLFLERKDYKNAAASLAAAQAKREKTLTHLKKTEDEGRYVADLKNRFVKSLENQRALLAWVAAKVPQEAQGPINENVAALNNLLSKLE